MDSAAPASSIVDRLADIYKDVSKSYVEGYRCRFDPEALQQFPLKPEEYPREKDHCLGCRYKERRNDPYCKHMLRSWKVLKELPPEEFSKYACHCPDICSSAV